MKFVVDILTDDLSYRLRPARADTALIHRLEVGESARAIARAFTHGPAGAGTGHKLPYTFVVGRDGLITQTLPLNHVGPHAWTWNARSYGVACVGDFTRDRPTGSQWDSAVALCACLMDFYGVVQVQGHTSVPMATTDDSKICPGKHWNMKDFQTDVVALSTSDAPPYVTWGFVSSVQ